MVNGWCKVRLLLYATDLTFNIDVLDHGTTCFDWQVSLLINVYFHNRWKNLHTLSTVCLLTAVL